MGGGGERTFVDAKIDPKWSRALERPSVLGGTARLLASPADWTPVSSYGGDVVIALYPFSDLTTIGATIAPTSVRAKIFNIHFQRTHATESNSA